EGTRSTDGTLGPFKKGGFVLAEKSSVPVIPVGIRGSGEILAPGTWRIHPGTLEVHIGTPMHPRDFPSREAFVAAAREAVGRLSGRPLAPDGHIMGTHTP